MIIQFICFNIRLNIRIHKNDDYRIFKDYFDQNYELYGPGRVHFRWTSGFRKLGKWPNYYVIYNINRSSWTLGWQQGGSSAHPMVQLKWDASPKCFESPQKGSFDSNSPTFTQIFMVFRNFMVWNFYKIITKFCWYTCSKIRTLELFTFAQLINLYLV